ncbi:hypothetical protein F5878DRAFT_667867 [Lentinula raphanica]|uniref:Uncharacterized protein n=1 Tax=Lentinula raphanica TaxID=153919 RepID=A0AA38U3W6_9AGAR|nr:hypothetical protein F5878DRAFT_667867 [Lentinula raphanica]
MTYDGVRTEASFVLLLIRRSPPVSSWFLLIPSSHFDLCFTFCWAYIGLGG